MDKEEISKWENDEVISLTIISIIIPVKSEPMETQERQY